MSIWTPSSWQKYQTLQQVLYPSPAEVDIVLKELMVLPPLVTIAEIEQLKAQLALAEQGRCFLLQGGDCAERFVDCNEKTITNKIRILLQMSLILIHGLKKPVVRVGRMAGQYAKPRSTENESRDQLTLPVFRGDLINDPHFSLPARTPDPWRMLQGYQYSAITLNYIRALTAGGFADLLHSDNWELEFAKNAPYVEEYHHIVKELKASLTFMQTIHAIPEALRHVDFYISHEALHLPYEQALTRQEENNHWYNLSTHFPWIGMRTAQADGGHIEYLRGIHNPIALKVGPSVTPAALQEIIPILNPNHEHGRLTLITRLGAQHIEQKLPVLLEAVHETGIPVLWSSDPMHGNTITTSEGIKTRKFDDILSELKQAFAIHHRYGSHLGGVHFELTGDNVTECIGGARGLTEADLDRAYETLVDPRLNYEQALEMALLIAQANR